MVYIVILENLRFSIVHIKVDFFMFYIGHRTFQKTLPSIYFYLYYCIGSYYLEFIKLTIKKFFYFHFFLYRIANLKADCKKLKM